MPQTPSLPYDPKSLPRELRRHYIGASEQDIQAMLSALGLHKLEDLYGSLPPSGIEWRPVCSQQPSNRSDLGLRQCSLGVTCASR